MYADAQIAIEAECQARWAADEVIISNTVGDTPLRAPMDFENVPLADADLFDFVLRPRVTFVEADNLGLGATCKRYRGLLDMCIFHKPGNGMSTAMRLADDVCKHFDNRHFGIYCFYVGRVRKLPGAVQGWVQTIVSLPFEFDIRS